MQVITWILLFLLIPAGGVGYFAEISNPGDTLYPVKKDIETMVLTIESVNKSAQTFYQIELAGVRFKEAEKANIASNNTKFLVDFTEQVTIAEKDVMALPEGSAKTKTKQQLLGNITQYQQTLKQVVQNAPTISGKSNSVNSPSNGNAGTQRTVNALTPQMNAIIRNPNIQSPNLSPTPQPGTTAGSTVATNTIAVVQSAEQQLEIARLKLLSTYSLDAKYTGNMYPPGLDINHSPNILFNGADGSWCVSDFNGDFSLKSHCESGHYDADHNFIFDEQLESACLPSNNTDIFVSRCTTETFAWAGQPHPQVQCIHDPANVPGPAYLITTNRGGCAHNGAGSVCSNGACTKPTGPAVFIYVSPTSCLTPTSSLDNWCHPTVQANAQEKISVDAFGWPNGTKATSVTIYVDGQQLCQVDKPTPPWPNWQPAFNCDWTVPLVREGQQTISISATAVDTLGQSTTASYTLYSQTK